jgi:hypothetical protein
MANARGRVEGSSYGLPYPLASDFVNVHGHIEQLVRQLETVLPSASYSQVKVKNTSSEKVFAGDPLYVTGYTDITAIARAKSSTTQPILGLAKNDIEIGLSGIAVVSGVLEGIDTLGQGYAAGDILYAGEFGGLTKTQDVGGAVGIVAGAGLIIVEAKGNGTWGALKAGLA